MVLAFVQTIILGIGLYIILILIGVITQCWLTVINIILVHFLLEYYRHNWLLNNGYSTTIRGYERIVDPNQKVINESDTNHNEEARAYYQAIVDELEAKINNEATNDINNNKQDNK